MENKRNIYLDLFKFILAFMVVCIHFNTDSVLFPIYRVAVPSFFMISGYFSFSNDQSLQNQKNKKLIKSAIRYLIIGSVIYLIFDLISIFVCLISKIPHTELQHLILTGKISGMGMPLLFGHHLWFLLSLLILALLHYLICKHQKENWYKFLIPISILLALFLGGYGSLFNIISLPQTISRNAFLIGLPLFGIGFNIKKHNVCITSKLAKLIILFLAIIILFLSILESKIVVLEYYICSVISSCCFLLFFVSIKPKNSKFNDVFYKVFGTNCPFYIYIVHIMVGTHIKAINLPSIVIATLTFFISMVIYALFFFIFNSIKAKKQLRCNDTSYKNVA